METLKTNSTNIKLKLREATTHKSYTINICVLGTLLYGLLMLTIGSNNDSISSFLSIHLNQKFNNHSTDAPESSDISQCLVIIFGQARAHELTYTSFKKHLLDANNCDFALSVGTDTDREINPFYLHAKYIWVWNEHQFDSLHVTDAEFWRASINYLYKLTMKEIKYNIDYPIFYDNDELRFEKSVQMMDTLFYSLFESTRIHLFFRLFTYFKIKEFNLLKKYYLYLCSNKLSPMEQSYSLRALGYIGGNNNFNNNFINQFLKWIMESNEVRSQDKVFPYL
eukprot:465460_1